MPNPAQKADRLASINVPARTAGKKSQKDNPNIVKKPSDSLYVPVASGNGQEVRSISSH
jgi:hypothetical protein